MAHENQLIDGHIWRGLRFWQRQLAEQPGRPQSELTATPTTHDTRRLVWLDRQLDPLTEAASYEPQIAAN